MPDLTKKLDTICNIVAMIVLGAICISMVAAGYDAAALITAAVGIGTFLLGRAGKSAKVLLPVLALVLFVGCDVNRSSISEHGINAYTQPMSMAQMDNDGLQKAGFLGVAPTQLKQDADGSWLTTPGQGAVVTINPETKQAYIWSPKDGKIDRLEIREDGTLLIEGLEFNMSSVAEVYMLQYRDGVNAMDRMTQSQAEVYIQNAVTAGEMIPAVAEMLLKAFVPTLPQ